jgi:prepilin-type processing-associated H-X9-DG protein
LGFVYSTWEDSEMRITFRIALVLALLLACPLMAQPLADRVPADALVYVGWRGSTAMPPAYAQSHLKAVIDHSKINELFTEMIPQLIEKAAAADRNTRQPLTLARTLLAQAWAHPTAVWFAGVDSTNPRQPVPRLGLICQAGADAAALQQQIAGLIAQAPPNAQMRSAVVGDAVVITVGYPDPAQALGGGAALSAAPEFAAALKHVQADSVYAVYADVEKLIALIETAAATNMPPNQRQMVPKIIDALGLRGLKRAAMTGGFDGQDWMEQMFVDAPAPRAGLLAAFDAAPVSADLLKAIPADATFAVSVRFDPAAMITAIRTAAGQIDPQAQRVVDQALGAVQLAIARNPMTDILQPLGHDWAMYCAPSVSGNGILGMVAINKLDDPAKAGSALPTAWINLSNWGAIMLNRARAEVQITGRMTEIDGMKVYYAGTPIVAPGWTIRDGYLYMGLFPQSVAAGARAMSRASGKSIADNPAYQAVQKRLGATAPMSFSFYDLPVTATQGASYQQLMVLIRYGGFGDLFGVPLPEPLLPPLDVLQQHLSPAGSVGWLDDAGYHVKSIEPFPGSKLLSEPGMISNGAPATGGMLVAILLPSLNRARETANRVKCAANLRSLGQGCLLYANENQGKYPPDLGTLATYMDGMGVVRGTVFTCPTAVTAPPANLAALPIDQYAGWVVDNSSYIYLGGGKTSGARPEIVIMYEKPEDHGDGINMLFADGHVEYQRMPAAMELIQKQQAGGQ